MASKSACDICLKRDKTTVAFKFCSDCEHKLCKECEDAHGMFLVSHNVIDVNVATDQSFEIKKICSNHPEMILEFYCSDHDVMCCRSCMADEHRTCGKLLPLEVAAKDIKRSVLFENISADVEQLNKTSASLEDVEEKFRTILEGSKTDAKKKISNLKVKLLERINQLESNCLSDIDTVYAKLATKVKKSKTNVDSQMHTIKDISRRFDLVTKHGSESQIFLMLNSIKSEISKTSSDLEHFVPTLKYPSIAFKEGDWSHLTTSFGLVTETESASNIEYKPLQNQQAQIIQTMGSVPTKFQKEKEVALPPLPSAISITDIGVTKDNKIVLCNWGSHDLLVLTASCQYLGNITLSSNPWCIAIPLDSDVAWLTLPHCTYVQVVNTRTYVPTRKVRVQSSGYHGIAVVGDNIALGNKGKVDIIDKNGGIHKSLKIGTSTLYSLCASRNDGNKLYCCETGAGFLHCINMDGTVVLSDRSLEGPIGVITDGHGNLYVLTHTKHELHRFSDNGEPVDVILTNKDGLNSPYSCVFNANFTKLFIPGLSNGKLLIFSCT